MSHRWAYYCRRFLWAYAFSQLPAGALVDRVGPRWLLGFGLMIWSGAQIAAGTVGSITQFAIARVGLSPHGGISRGHRRRPDRIHYRVYIPLVGAQSKKARARAPRPGPPKAEGLWKHSYSIIRVPVVRLRRDQRGGTRQSSSSTVDDGAIEMRGVEIIGAGGISMEWLLAARSI